MGFSILDRSYSASIRFIGVTCGLAALSFGATQAAEWNPQAAIGIEHVTNVNNSPFDDATDDRIVRISAAIDTQAPLGLSDDFVLGLNASNESYDRYSGLNHQSLGASLAWKKKIGMGPYAPWTGITLASTRLLYKDSIRNGWHHELTFSAAQRLNETWKLNGAFVIERRNAKSLQGDQPQLSGDVFSQNNQSLKLGLDHVLTEAFFMKIGFAIRHGDIVSTALEYPGTNIIDSSKASTLEESVFGPKFYTYRLDGVTRVMNIDANMVLPNDWLLILAVNKTVARATGGNNYRGSTQSLTLSHDF